MNANRLKKLFVKIKDKGFRGCWNSIVWRVNNRRAIIDYSICSLFPLNSALIVFESDGDLTDNTYALYEYMKSIGYLNKYKVIWAVHNVKKAKKKQHDEPEKFPNTDFINKDLAFNNIRRNFYLATCKYYIYDHSNLVSGYRRRKGQSVIFISHGFGVKAGKGIAPVRNGFDINVVLGKIPAENAALDWGGTYAQTRQWGYPRNDYFFQNNKIIKDKLEKMFLLSDYKKVIIWMPTFRQTVSYGAALSEEYIHNETGLPLFQTFDALYQFDNFLESIGCLVILKLHPLQANLPVFEKHYKNIKVVRNEDLQNIDVQLYQILGFTDCLITDYSSVSTDYMLLNKPIIYILDDLREYESSRGLSPANAVDLLIGYHVYNIDQLENALIKVTNGMDDFKEARNKLLPSMHKYHDGNSSKRIIKNLRL